MASLEKRKSGYRVIFMWGGKRIHRSLDTHDKAIAENHFNRLEQKLSDWKLGLLEIPPEADVATFLLSDGKRVDQPQAIQPLTLADLFDSYFSSLPDGALEENSLYTARIHRNHLQEVLGKDFPIESLTRDDLQRYIKERAKKKTRKGTVGPTTIRKELSTLGAVWSSADLGVFPGRKLNFPKGHEKPPFQTWKEIEKQIAAGAHEELWESLFLSIPQINQALEFVKKTTPWPCMFPILAMAAYTGARRSELLRSERTDFTTDAVTIREKKRTKGKYTTRTVPLAKPFRQIIHDWLADQDHQFTFGSITVDQSNHYFRMTLTDKWSKIRGWHTFRHSFASNCAAAGVDQRMINAWMGHQTEEMMRRYQHLFPHDQQNAMDSVFK